MATLSTYPRVDLARCDLCGLCAEACPCHAIRIGATGLAFACGETCPRPIADAARTCCAFACEEACPTGALRCVFEIVLDIPEGPKTGPSELF